MTVFRLAITARATRRALAENLRQVQMAQKLLDDSHQRVVRAQELVARRGGGPFPDPSAADTADRELISAVDDWLAIRTQVHAPLSEIRRTLKDHEDSIRVVRSRRLFLRHLLSSATRSVLPDHVHTAHLALTAATRVLDSRLTQTALIALARRRSDPYAALAKYRRNNAYFVAAIEHFNSELAGETNRDPVSGGLPAEIAARVEATLLLPGPFRSLLRRYQDFGARYVVTQKRVILGDEMGLGKTVQALAAMCHLHALGARNLLVVAPNSVVVNWERETSTHTSLESVVIHGPQREHRLRDWADSGRVGITTFGTFPKIAPLIGAIDMLVVDEAHHVKNPATMRTAAVDSVAARSDHVVLMTGTALENRLSELQSLAILAEPQMRGAVENVAATVNPDPDVVATMLAPVYLRRTQDDVLKELPEQIHVDEWVDLTDDDHVAYLSAPPTLVQKRLAAVVGDGTALSAKYQRFTELIDDHREAGHKIVVFSFFRRVITEVCDMVETALVITGDSSPTERQRVIDDFADAPPGAVLVAQIDAGGSGINLQMAQVVILMEPSLKPSTEWQAVARVHRMGQVRPVMVHRLLARGTVEEHLLELLNAKEQEFLAYAHDSAVKHESRMATDTGEANLSRQLQRLLDEGEIT